MDGVLDILLEKLNNAKRYTKYISAQCPFHDDSKNSLLVYEDWFRCLGCGREGRPEELLHAESSIAPTTQKSKHYFPHIEGIPSDRLVKQAHKILTETPAHQEYLVRRGLGPGIAKFNLGWWDGWYTIPVYNEKGELGNVIFRASPWIEQTTGDRFWREWGQQPSLYTPDRDLLEGANNIYVTFGLFDAASLALLGVPAITSDTSKHVFSPSWAHAFRCPIWIIPDLGEEADALSLAAKLDWRGHVLKLNYQGDEKDPNDIFKHDPERLKEELNARTNQHKTKRSK